MTSSEIIALVAAGYSKAEIEAMSAAPENDPQPEPAPAADPQPTEDPVSAADPQPVQDDRIEVLEQAIIKLTQAIQGANILNSGKGAAPTLTAEDALASLIKGGE